MEEKQRLVEDETSESLLQQIQKINPAEFIYQYRIPLSLFLVGAILVGFGVFSYKKGYLGTSDKIEVLEDATAIEKENVEIVVEIAGAVESPGIYKFKKGDRVDDLLIASGGLSADADREWIARMINRAAKLIDGQKLYIPNADESVSSRDEQSGGASANFSGGSEEVLGSQGSGQTKAVNINTASQSELESLWGIGPVYAQNIIEHRPYSSISELLEKKIIKKNVYDRNEDRLTVY